LHGTRCMRPHVNVNTAERWASALGGAAIAAAGVRRFFDADRAAGSLIGAAGAALIWRGATGHCHMYEAAGVSTARDGDTRAHLSGDRGVNVEELVTIARTPYELYQRWREFDWLPRVIPGLLAVERMGTNQSRWIARGPGGYRVEWTAE